MIFAVVMLFFWRSDNIEIIIIPKFCNFLLSGKNGGGGEMTITLSLVLHLQISHFYCKCSVSCRQVSKVNKEVSISYRRFRFGTVSSNECS